MHSADGRYSISFNGEVYNFRALAAELVALGHGFRGHSDTEIMLAAVCQWGVPGALRRFQGMFAFALWDRRECKLILARDRAGKKPLYYGQCGDSFLFGSELKALRAHPRCQPGIDRDALALFLQYAWVPGPRSIYAGIHKLPPGHWLEVGADGAAAPHSYWSASEAALAGQVRPFEGGLPEAVQRLQEVLREAVACRMIADVPLGALLSGGYDSTIVTALMQEASSAPVKTFTIGFDDSRYDESGHARAIAAHLGTEHRELTVAPADALALVTELPHMYDEPFADASQIPTHIVSRLARSEVTVALSGDGGDELFAGYGRYRRPARDLGRWSALPTALRGPTASLLDQCAAVGWSLLQPPQGGDTLPAWRRFPARLNKNIAALRATGELDLFARQRARLASGADLVIGANKQLPPLRGMHEAAALAQPEQGMMLLDFNNYLVDDILVKVDRASMAVSLETRAPLLDYRVVEFAWSLPLALRLDAGGGKRVLRELLRRYVPQALTDRPKRGFGVPVGDWLRGPLKDWAAALLDRERLAREAILEPAAVARLWQQHQCGWLDHSDVLWSLLMFQAWQENATSP